MIEFSHIPVMFNECMENLQIKKGGVYLDGTLGGGGHTEGILNRGGKVFGIDRDDDALKYTTNRLKGMDLTPLKGNFKDCKKLLEDVGVTELDGAILDLGVSSYQLDDGDRGFSYRYDAPLDMRMDRSSAISAMNIVNEYDYNELARIIFEYGEERYARQIAKKILENRPVKTTFQLVDIIKSAMPTKALRDKHPAKRTFQAIRIAVNNELTGLDGAIIDICDMLKTGGRLAVITFHSLEDRIVKNTFSKLATGCTCPKDFPICVCNNKAKAKLVNKKPIVACEKEMTENTRSTCAKLRILERV